MREKSGLNQLSIQPAPLKPYYNLSASQKRLYFLHQVDKSSLAYNLPQVLELAGSIDISKVEHTVKKLIAHHESLRTSIVTIHEEPFQKINDQVDFSVEFFEASREEIPEIVQGFIRPFSIGQSSFNQSRFATINFPLSSANGRYASFNYRWGISGDFDSGFHGFI